ncbi:MAG: DUF3575 domain-containing protein [Crocinitomicaceae bacterium]
MKKTLIICFLLTSMAAFSQKNAVKLVLAPVKLIVANNVGLAYERKFTDRFTASLKFNFSTKSAAPLSTTLTEFAKEQLDSANANADIFNNKFKSSGLTLELRYYPGSKALKGFYLAPYFGLQTGSFANFDFDFPDNTNELIKHGGNVDMGFNFIGGGLAIGNQWTIADKISIDILWIGLGVGSNNFGITGTELDGQEVDFDAIDKDVEEFINSQDGIVKRFTSDIRREVTDEYIKLTSKNLVPYTKFFNVSIGYCF